MRKLIAAINMALDGFCDHTAVNADDELPWKYFLRWLYRREVQDLHLQLYQTLKKIIAKWIQEIMDGTNVSFMLPQKIFMMIVARRRS
jgi:hypothetical protein